MCVREREREREKREEERGRERESEGGRDLTDVLAQDVDKSHVLWRRKESHLHIVQVRETKRRKRTAGANEHARARA